MEIRQLTGLSQQEIAAMLDVSRSAIAMYEKNERSLPSHASRYESYLLTEMDKPENKNSITPPTLSNDAVEKWKQELQKTARRCRYEAETLKQRMEEYEKKEMQRLGRLLLVPCAKKALAELKELSQKPGLESTFELHDTWLEIQEKKNNRDRFDEKAGLEHLRNQFRYNMLIKEAEEAEKMAGEI